MYGEVCLRWLQQKWTILLIGSDSFREGLFVCVCFSPYFKLASLVAQMVKNPPAMRETCVQFLGWEDPLEEGMATHSSVLAWRIHLDRGA